MLIYQNYIIVWACTILAGSDVEVSVSVSVFKERPFDFKSS